MAIFHIERLDQIRALSSAARQDIVDAVTAIGPATAPEIARALHRKPDGLYFHLRALARVGLLKQGERSNSQGRIVATYDVPGRPMRIRYDLAAGAGARAISRVTASMLRTANRGFARAAAKGEARVDGARRELWAARTHGWLSPKALEEVNRNLTRIIALVRSGPAPRNACSYEVTFVLSPSRSD